MILRPLFCEFFITPQLRYDRFLHQLFTLAVDITAPLEQVPRSVDVQLRLCDVRRTRPYRGGR